MIHPDIVFQVDCAEEMIDNEDIANNQLNHPARYREIFSGSKQ
jgi:hypothetical protein